MKLTGKIALITGGNSGIGLATAQLFVREGAHVIITGRRRLELEAAEQSLGLNALAVQCDVSELSDLDRLYALIREKFGSLDIVFANAGMSELTPLESVSEKQFDQIFNVNTKGVFFTIQKSVPLLKKGASIIMTSSVAGTKGLADFSVYAASKAAVRSLARCWTNELKARKIRVNAISPGPIETPIFDKMGARKDQIDTFKNDLAATIPLGRLGRPEEIAQAALFLASDDSSYITGIELFVDGGLAQV
ncbi:MAG: glucose 1-dehydrogenase [Candidatus Nucleicultricaceae bacterium]